MDDDTTTAPRSRLRGCLAPGCLGILGLASSIYGVGTLGAERAVTAHRAGEAEVLAGLSADGLGVTKAELVPKPSAPSDLDRLWQVINLAENLPEEEAAALELYRLEAFAPAQKKGFLGLPEEEELLKTPTKWDAALQRALKALAKVDPALDQVLARESIALDLTWEDGLTMQLPHLMPLKKLVQQLAGRALQRQVTGRPQAAWADVARSLRLIQRWREPLLISYLVRRAMLAVTLEAVPRLLRHGPPPDEARWRELDGLLLALDDSADLTDAFRGELLAVQVGVTVESALQEAGLGFPVYRIPVVGRWKLSADRLDYLRRMAQAIRATTRGARAAHLELQRLEREVAQGDGGYLATMLFPSLAKVAQKHRASLARVRMTRMAFNLARAASADGGLPTTPAQVLTDPTAPDGSGVQWLAETPRKGRLRCVGTDKRLEVVVELPPSKGKTPR